MPNWTPGPWKWENYNGVWRLRSVAACERSSCPEFDGNDPIVDDGSAGGEYSQTIDPTTSANASLIAAAPDLYAALQALREEIARYPNLGHEGSELLECMSDARAALAKAEAA